MLQRDPMETEELPLGYDAALEDLARLGQESRHDGVRLGSVRARLDVMRAKIDLLTVAGALPRDLGRFAEILDGQRTARTMIAVLERHDVPASCPSRPPSRSHRTTRPRLLGAEPVRPNREGENQKGPVSGAFTMGDTGLEPVTSALSRRRSPS